MYLHLSPSFASFFAPKCLFVVKTVKSGMRHVSLVRRAPCVRMDYFWGFGRRSAAVALLRTATKRRACSNTTPESLCICFRFRAAAMVRDVFSVGFDWVFCISKAAEDGECGLSMMVRELRLPAGPQGCVLPLLFLSVTFIAGKERHIRPKSKDGFTDC
jgi:hypothetical protein